MFTAKNKSINKKSKEIHNNSPKESGNIFAILFGAVALTGILAVVGMQTVTGPITTITKATQKNMVENDLMTAAKILIATASGQANNGDCDSDGFVEPEQWRATTGPKPTNGGLMPNTVGASLTDPWGTEYGYCVWDHATLNNVGCGGGTQRRLLGPSPGRENQLVLAIIAAGPDKAFQTTCRAWVDANADGNPDQPMVEKTVGSDDYIVKFTYAEAANTGAGLWNIKVGSPDTAQIDKDIEIKDSGGTVKVAVSRDTGIGDFLGLTTDIITAKTGGKLFLDGNVGIGTNDPLTTLHVRNSASGKAFTNNTGLIVESNGNSNGFFVFQAATTGAPNALSVTNAGNVGLGVASPSALLHLHNTTPVLRFTIPASNAADQIGIEFAEGATAAAQIKIRYDALLNSPNNKLHITNASTDLFTFEQSGRFGIGATAPQDNLHLQGTGSLGLWMEADTDDANEGHNPMIRMTQDGGTIGMNIGFLNDGDSGNTFRLGRRRSSVDYWDTFAIKTDNGYIGIGTSTPTELLDLNGTLKFRADGVLMKMNGETTGSGAPSADGLVMLYEGGLFGSTYDGLVIEKTDMNAVAPDGGIMFANRGNNGVRTSTLVIRGNGRVGIGVDAPEEKLDVNGVVKATSLLLTSDARMKEGIRPLNEEFGALSIVERLKPVRYHWKDKNQSQRPQIGLLAQDIEAVLPDIVGGTDDSKSVDYIQLIPVLVQAMQEQQAIIQSQAEQIKHLSQRLDNANIPSD